MAVSVPPHWSGLNFRSRWMTRMVGLGGLGSRWSRRGFDDDLRLRLEKGRFLGGFSGLADELFGFLLFQIIQACEHAEKNVNGVVNGRMTKHPFGQAL